MLFIANILGGKLKLYYDIDVGYYEAIKKGFPEIHSRTGKVEKT